MEEEWEGEGREMRLGSGGGGEGRSRRGVGIMKREIRRRIGREREGGRQAREGEEGEGVKDEYEMEK